ncbi:MAG: hypothetical protein K6D94_12780 [Clostridiales bacterium]|nr:hypothetical protein [Clostridiales bacterium]
MTNKIKIVIFASALTAMLSAVLFFSSSGSSPVKKAEQPDAAQEDAGPWEDKALTWLSRDFSVTNTSGDSLDTVVDFESQGGVIAAPLSEGLRFPGNANVPVIIEMDTGEMTVFCPDPGCRHEQDSDCGYAGFTNLVSYGDENIYYGIKHIEDEDGPHMIIAEAIPGEDSVKEIYRGESENGEFHFAFVRAVTENAVFIIDTFKTETLPSGQRTGDEIWRYVRYDRRNGDTEIIGETVNGDYFWSFPVVGSGDASMVHYTGSESEVYEHTFSDQGCLGQRSIFTCPEGLTWNGDIYGDSETGDLYLCATSGRFSGTDEFRGYIYVVRPDGESERLGMPTDNIYGFCLTDKYIYYSVFDPVKKGDGKNNVNPFHEIYRVNRDLTSPPELVFDTEGEFMSPFWRVCGDCLYFDYYKFSRSGTGGNYSNIGVYAAVNFAQDSLKWYMIDD